MRRVAVNAITRLTNVALVDFDQTVTRFTLARVRAAVARVACLVVIALTHHLADGRLWSTLAAEIDTFACLLGCRLTTDQILVGTTHNLRARQAVAGADAIRRDGRLN